MPLNYITPKKSNQWPKVGISLVLLLVLLAPLFFFILKNNQEKSGVYYVDVSYNGWLKWGSRRHPYENIARAFQTASRRKITAPAIHLKNGEYNEKLEIVENSKVYGESRDGVILKGDDLSPVVIMKNNSSISNLTIIGGSKGIEAENQATIENCSLKNFRLMGIDASPSNSEIVIKNSDIYNGRNKGIYIQKGRKINISGNKIHDNPGEGIDVRAKVSGVIGNNEIYNNVESGIEFIVGGSSLDIKENNIWNNEAAGITAQYYEENPEKGEIVIRANRIGVSNPDKYTISVKSPSGGEGRIKNYWRDSIEILSDNILDGEIKTRSLEITEYD